MKKSKLISGQPLSLNVLAKYVENNIRNLLFPGSAEYWENRYRKNGNSGNGSYGKNAAYKAGFLNQFVKDHKVSKVIEFGCGDGNQLQQFQFPKYFGLDVSPTAIQLCRSTFQNDHTKQFTLSGLPQVEARVLNFNADLSLSLDVIFHLVEDAVFEKYMRDLFGATSKFVIIYSWDVEEGKKGHVRQRNFSKWVIKNQLDFQLIDNVSNRKDNFCDFFVYKRKEKPLNLSEPNKKNIQ